MSRQLNHHKLRQLKQVEDISGYPFADMVRLVQEEPGIMDYLPDGHYAVDPRDGARVVYHAARSRRPHDNRPEETQIPERDCLICQGKTTGVIDMAPLSEGYTFINKNLFPVIYPLSEVPGEGEHNNPISGFHLLQWTSSFHDRDWHNLPSADRVTVLKRLAVLERTLLGYAEELPPLSDEAGGLSRERGYVSIFKNFGRLVGGSLVHGHQQIALTNLMPRRVWENKRFRDVRGEKFSDYLLRENHADLVVRDYGLAQLVVPHFMRRPYDMMLLVKDTSKDYLHQLSPLELKVVGDGWHDALRAIHTIMPQIGRELAYNVIVHNGPGAGLYFEFLPYTQEIGGFEHLGIFVCQGSPGTIADRLRGIVAG